MSYGIKISQSDIDVNTEIKNEAKPTPLANKAHMLLSLAMPYLEGAYTQIDRYKTASDGLTPEHAVKAVNSCLHESSSLFEDICTVSKYLSDLCGYSNDKHQLWIDIRNHIRHDVRENFDTSNKLDIERRKKRLSRLGLSNNFQSSIEFGKDRVKIGAIVITLEEIEEYLSWASQIIADVLNKAEAEGKIVRT